MTTATHSTVFDSPTPNLWAVVRDFGNYSLWVDGASTRTMEPGRSSSCVGAARIIDLPDRRIVQRLTAFSDADRAYRYSFEAGRPDDITDYEATLALIPITADDRTLVVWSAEFETRPDLRQHWQQKFAGSFAGWLEHLRELPR